MDSANHLGRFSNRRIMPATPYPSGSSPTSTSTSSSMRVGSNAQWTSQPYKARGMDDVQNRSTISKDKIQGDEQRMADLLAQHGNKVMRSQHMALNADTTHSALQSLVNTLRDDQFGRIQTMDFRDGDHPKGFIEVIDPAESDKSSMSGLSETSDLSKKGDNSDKGDDLEKSNDWEGRYPKRGKTRIPDHLVHEDALQYLGYHDYVHDGNIIVIQLALGKSQIDELLQTADDIREGRLKLDKRR
ncbi:hypothetical protein M431DRAFT_495779 [Trichoderma harzianum CBS 226.95]|uniref:DUF8035 domain-containing protein n=1 Tax=Trichoderma harzianum CBS 226.95 TaxID=983964 RepID=A0A2T4A9S8_TRIHA|nr:hypothetical protein M431DRAFT_495779 [Trichoderma harzianum CBS 226.95]PTB53827.1 hypothetical protein M431DRAFT_495779 [Trichoderma harzianum CBS 226.95]